MTKTKKIERSNCADMGKICALADAALLPTTAQGEAKCGWEYMNGRRCCKPAIAIWTIITSTHVCKHHAKEVNRMRMGKLSMLTNDKLSDGGHKTL